MTVRSEIAELRRELQSLSRQLAEADLKHEQYHSLMNARVLLLEAAIIAFGVPQELIDGRKVLTLQMADQTFEKHRQMIEETYGERK